MSELESPIVAERSPKSRRYPEDFKRSAVRLVTKHSKNVVKFYNGRGTAEQWIKEGKNAVKWTKLSCRTFRVNQTRLQLFALAYNLANFFAEDGVAA